MMDELRELLFTPWGWFILGLVLAVLEVLAPGTFMIWLAFAAGATGLVTLVWGFGWPLQLVTFALLSVFSVLAGRSYFRRNPGTLVDSGLNTPSTRLLGQTVTVVEAIEDGRGRVKIADSPWIAEGPDMPAGAKARIVRIDGSVAHVEPLTRA